MLLVKFCLILALVWQAALVLSAQPPAGGPECEPCTHGGRGGRAAHHFTAADPDRTFAIQYDAPITRGTSPEFGQIIPTT
jgi:hypothetical protein